MGLRPGAITPPRVVAPAGAARTLDYHWPSYFGTDGTMTQRGGAAGVVQILTTLDGTAAWNLVASAGVPLTRLQAGTGGGVVYMSAQRLAWYTERPAGTVSSSRNCWDIGMVCRFDAPAAALAGDMGVMICCGATDAINGTGALTQPGILFGPTGPGAVAFRARAVNAGGYTVTEQLTPTKTPDVTQLHDWRIRIVTGGADFDPYAVGMIDGAEVTDHYSWTAAAGKLPGPAAYAANNIGYRAAWGCRGNGNIGNWDIAETYLRAAETAAGLA